MPDPRPRTSADFLNGVPELLVLRLLVDRPMHGYELLRAIEQTSEQVLEFGEGCIYPLLHRLEHDGFLTSRRETVQGRSRVVYRVTARGRGRFEEAQATWQRVSAAVAQVLTRPACQPA